MGITVGKLAFTRSSYCKRNEIKRVREIKTSEKKP